MKEFNLPVNYSKTKPQDRRLVREQYIREQNGLCYWCEMPLKDAPPKHITDIGINWRNFPQGFLNAPIHLQHDHGTNLTEGAVHAYCNAVMWQVHRR